ncbi:MAG: Mur ligase family protein [bacterium]|nr:Mur ligase family protein [bacterium]
METLLKFGRKVIPKKIFKAGQPVYHFVLAFLAALFYGFPSCKIKIIGVTGTKGKTTVAELVNAILEEAGYKTAILGTLRFKIGNKDERNLFKMTMPGRLFVQKFLRKAVKDKCDYAIMEMTSEGAKQFRQRFISMDALIFTNLAPEHIESHGSYEKYKQAKLSIARTLARSSKRPRVLVVNKDDKEAESFLSVSADKKLVYSLSDTKGYRAPYLIGEFNTYNTLAAATMAEGLGVSREVIQKALDKFKGVRGRMENVNEEGAFPVYIDYAHTPDSLEAAYKTLTSRHELVCVLGNTGGGRDTWKRKIMGKIADKYCAEIILTNEDPYDEDPVKIVNEMKEGITVKRAKIIMDRREAIREAIKITKLTKNNSQNPAVIITGKGTDPYIMGPNGAKEPWDDATVAREELNV